MQVHDTGRVVVFGNLLVVGSVLDGVRMRLVTLHMRVQLKLRPGHEQQGKGQHQRQGAQAAMAAKRVPYASDC